MGVEQMYIEIEDDFDLKKIAFCGQCFRAKSLDNGLFRFITGNHVIYLQDTGNHKFYASCSKEEWNDIWIPYFDISRSYRELRKRQSGKLAFVQKAMECGCGLRILRQDPWEMLVTFILSQRKSIPAISKSVEILAKKYGQPIKTVHEVVHSFPTAEQMRHVSENELRDCGLGYRAPYVADAIRRVTSGTLDLDAITACEDEELFRELRTVYGVGDKVANCICLYGYGRVSRAPVDVWIARAIRENCHGENPFPMFGADAGVIQQYIFYYEKNGQDR